MLYVSAAFTHLFTFLLLHCSSSHFGGCYRIWRFCTFCYYMPTFLCMYAGLSRTVHFPATTFSAFVWVGGHLVPFLVPIFLYALYLWFFPGLPYLTWCLWPAILCYLVLLLFLPFLPALLEWVGEHFCVLLWRSVSFLEVLCMGVCWYACSASFLLPLRTQVLWEAACALCLAHSACLCFWSFILLCYRVCGAGGGWEYCCLGGCPGGVSWLGGYAIPSSMGGSWALGWRLVGR
jgi:hypothetical protein